MKIWVMRHGEASFNTSCDSQRFLTEQGVKKATAQGKILGTFFRQHKIKLDKFIVSPYLRAKQTAEALKSGMQAAGFSENFTNIEEIWDELTPYGNEHLVIDYLKFLSEEGAKNILIISHLPLVYELVQELTQYQANVHFYPAVIAEINWLKNSGKLIQQFT